MTHAQLGNRAAAQAEVERTLRLWPKFEQIFGMKHLGKWFRNQPDLIAHILEGVKLAGFRTRPETVEGVRSGGVVEWWSGGLSAKLICWRVPRDAPSLRRR
jgi:hypothetical protein